MISPYCEKHHHTPYDSSCRDCFNLSIKENIINGVYMVLFANWKNDYAPCIGKIDDYFNKKGCDCFIFKGTEKGDTMESLVKEAKEIVNNPDFDFEKMVLAQKMK